MPHTVHATRHTHTVMHTQLDGHTDTETDRQPQHFEQQLSSNLFPRTPHEICTVNEKSQDSVFLVRVRFAS